MTTSQSSKALGASNALIIPDDQPCPPNQTMFQGFEWYCPADHKHWSRLAGAIPGLAGLGITSMWIPPATKAAWSRSNGYDIYDLYDLGEFSQKGARHTKWGTRDELAGLVQIANSHGIGILFDTVLNHKAAADHTETTTAVKVDPKGTRYAPFAQKAGLTVDTDRTKVVGKPEKIQTWTKFMFPGRKNAYSSFKWTNSHFTGVDYEHKRRTKGIWLFQGKSWADDVAHELGNYDYL